MLQKGMRLARCGSLALLGLAALVGHARAQQACNCVVDGYVTAQGRALPGAAVQVGPATAAADDKGFYRITGLCPGSAWVRSAYTGYHPFARQLVLEAGNTLHLDFALLEEAHQLDEVEVQGRRRPAQTAASATDQITQAQIQAAAGDPLGALLARQPGVSLLRTGPTVVKPVLRGLHSSRILILNAGVRHEGQQWGAEHAPELDPLASGKLTLVRGAATVRYGPEALGGVIIAEPPALPDSAGTSGGITMAGASNNGMGLAGGWLAYAPKAVPGLAIRVQGSLRRAGDSRAPDYVLSNTGLADQNGSYQLGYRRAHWGAQVSYAQFNTRLGILLASHTGSVSDIYQAIRTGRPTEVYPFTYGIQAPYQQVAHELLTARAWRQLSTRTRLEVQVARQFNGRQEYDRVRRTSSLAGRPAMELYLTTYSAEALLRHRFSQHLEGQAGVSAYLGRKGGGFDVGSSRFLLRSLLPDYTTQLAGAFALVEGEAGAYRYEAGARLDARVFDVQPGAWPGFATRRQFVLPSATASVSRRLGQHTELDATVSTSARPPSAAELYSRGLHQGSATIEVGNPALAPERMNAASLGLGYDGHHLRLKASAYVHAFNGYVNLVPDLPPALTVAGVFPVFAYRQQNALFRGLEGEAVWEPGRGWQLGAVAAIVRARDVNRGTWLLQIPADRYRFYLNHTRTQPLGPLHQAFAQAECSWVRRQTRPGDLAADSLDYADAPAGYALVSARVGGTLRLAARLRAQLSLEAQNLLNRRYRDYLDRFRYYADAPGRNFILRLTVPFGV